MENENPIVIEEVTLNEVGKRWFVFLRMLLIVFIIYISFHLLNPNIKKEFTVQSKVGDHSYFAVSEENKGEFFTDEQSNEKMEIGSLVWIYYKKSNMDIVKVKKK